MWGSDHRSDRAYASTVAQEERGPGPETTAETRAVAPILVTGTHRSGTTWVGRALSLSREATPIHEPFNPALPWTWLEEPAPRWFWLVTAEDDPEMSRQVENVVAFRPPASKMMARAGAFRERAAVLRQLMTAQRARLRRRRALVKDPLALFSAEWLADRFGSQNVVLIRHPAAFASSLKRLNWQFDFRNLSEQPQLVDRYLERFREDLDIACDAELDVIDQSILLWRMLNSVALDLGATHSDWAVLRYEDLATDPRTEFRSLYGHLGLRWGDHVERRLLGLTAAGPGEVPSTETGGVRRNSAEAMWTWTSRLTPREIARVRAGTEDVASSLYPSQEWSR